MTEDEAKMKWCPMARSMITRTSPYGGISVAGVNRWSDGQSQCKGSGCMAWRWNEDYWRAADGKCYGGPAEGREFVSNTGYCGLAGKP